MGTEMLSYSQLGDRLNCSPEAARSLVKRLRLPRQKANDGKVLVSRPKEGRYLQQQQQ